MTTADGDVPTERIDLPLDEPDDPTARPFEGIRPMSAADGIGLTGAAWAGRNRYAGPPVVPGRDRDRAIDFDVPAAATARAREQSRAGSRAVDIPPSMDHLHRDHLHLDLPGLKGLKRQRPLETRLTQVARVCAIVRDVLIVLLIVAALTIGVRVVRAVGDARDPAPAVEPLSCFDPRRAADGTVFCPGE